MDAKKQAFNTKFIRKNLLNILFVIGLLVLFFVPDAKAFFLKGLMEIGFYKPKTDMPAPVPMQLKGIQFSNAKGEQVDLGDLKGKVIFLNFWATWCPPCRAEMPSLNTLYKKYRNDPDVVFFFADADGDLGKANQFIQKHRYNLPVYKVEGSVPEQIFAGSLPTTVIFDKEGRLAFRHEGLADYSAPKFAEFLNALKNADQTP